MCGPWWGLLGGVDCRQDFNKIQNTTSVHLGQKTRALRDYRVLQLVRCGEDIALFSFKVFQYTIKKNSILNLFLLVSEDEVPLTLSKVCPLICISIMFFLTFVEACASIVSTGPLYLWYTCGPLLPFKTEPQVFL